MKEKRKLAMVICLAFCLSLLSNIVYALPEINSKDEQPIEQEQNIKDLEQLPEEVRNSKWFKLGIKENLYSHPTVYDLIGKSYLGESIEGILLMSEEIEDFNLKEFLGSSVCSKYTIDDFKSFKKRGMKTLMDIYEQENLKGGNGIKTMLRSLRSSPSVPSIGSAQWGTLTITGSRMYENSDAPALVGAFRNEGIINQWYISLFNVRLSGFGGEFAWLNGKTFNSVGNPALLGGDITNFVRCITPKKAAPSATMQASCLVRIEQLDPDNNRIRVSLKTSSFGSGYQAVGGPVYFEYTFPEPPPKDGYVKIQKTSSKPDLTNGNSAYSLKGAKFSVYSSDAPFTYEDVINFVESGVNPKGLKWYDNFITLSDGTARRQVYVSDGYEHIDEPDIGSILVEEHDGRDYYFYYEKNVSSLNVPVGHYGMVEEFVPGMYGYSLNNTVKNFEVTEGNTVNNPVTVRFSNVPILDPVAVILRKVDKETNMNKPAGSASLAKAEFIVKYYPVLVNDVTGLTPKYIWRINTDEDGYAKIPDNELPFVTYPDGSQRRGLPVGTITVQETKAPTGYLIDNTLHLRQITLTGGNAVVPSYNVPIIPEQVIRGGFTLYKSDKDRLAAGVADDKSKPQGDGVFTNATFTVTNISGQPVRVNGVDYANNAVCYTFKTDASGRFTSAGDLLPYGRYVIRETAAPTGYTVNTGWSATINITGNRVIVNANSYNDNPVSEQVIRGGFKIKKTDKDTGNNSAQGGAALQGAQFEVVNRSANAVYTQLDGVWGWRAPNSVCYKISTDANGIAQSPISALPYGSYRIRETGAPTGYLINNTWYRDFTIQNNGQIHDLTDITIPEQVIRGGFKIQKTDKETGKAKAQGLASLKNATFTVTNISGKSVRVGGRDYANNTVCYTFKTDENGRFTSPGNLLPYGNYRINETVASGGYLVNTGWSAAVNIRTNGTIVDLTDNPVPEQIIRGGFKMQKTDKETGQANPQGSASLKDATFTVANISGDSVRVDGKDYPNNTVCYTFKTDENGQFTSPANLLPYGNYRIREKAPSNGYLINTEWFADVYIRDNGVIVDVTNNPVPEQVIRGGLQLVKFKEDDKEIKTPLAGVVFTLTHNKTGEKVTITTDDNGYARTANNALVFGKWTVEETGAPVGHPPIQPFTVDIKDDGYMHYFIIENQTIRSAIRIVKIDNTTGNIIPMADTEFQIKNSATGEVIEFTTYYPNIQTFTTLKTGEDGTCMLPELLEVGSYEVIELKAPYGYLQANHTVKFDVTENMDYAKPLVVTFPDTPAKGKILINKTGDIYTGFEEEYHELIGTVRKPKFENGKLAGVKFNIIAAEDIVTGDGTIRLKQGEIADTIITTEGDDYSKELYLGKYIVQEVETPEGYITNTTGYNITLEYKDQFTHIVIGVVELENEWLNSHIELIKEKQELNLTYNSGIIRTELSVKPGEGFIFALYAGEDIRDIPKDSAVAYGTTNKEGKLIFEGQLPHGMYYLKEINTDSSYHPNETKYPVDLRYTEDLTLIRVEHKALNELIKKKVTITKTDITGEKPVAGAVVEIYDSNTGEVVYQDITSEDGELKDIILLPGKYAFKETLAPSGYALNTNIYEFEITESGEIKGDTSLKNDTNRIIFKKIGVSENNPLKGARFGLFNKENELVQETVSGEGGIFSFEQIPYGEYTVKEIEAPEGYIRSDKEYRFTIDGRYINTAEIRAVFENARLVTITKTDITGEKPVAGAEVEICDSDGKTIYNAVTDENGTLPDIQISKPGKYTFKETLAPSGYALNTNIYDFEVTESGDIKGDTSFKNDITRISLYKTDGKDGAQLSGAKFGLFNEKGELLEEGITDINGLTEFSGMEYGKYIIKELEAPEGYKVSDKTITVYIDGTWENGEPIDFENSRLTIGKIPAPWNPKTGDKTGRNIYVAVMALSVAGGIGLYLIKRKKRVKKNKDV